MSNVDMRKLIETVDQSERIDLDETGGFIDKIMAKLPGGEKAETRVQLKKEVDHIKKGWNQYSTIENIKKDDIEGVKGFLTWWNFDSDEIDNIIGDEISFNFNQALDRAAATQWKSGKGATGAERGGPFKQEKPAGDDYASIMQFYTKSLGGNPAMLQAEFAAVKKPQEIGNDPLGRK